MKKVKYIINTEADDDVDEIGNIFHLEHLLRASPLPKTDKDKIRIEYTTEGEYDEEN